MQEELDKNDIENAENLLNEQQVPKHNDGESTSCTEETLSCIDGTNQESPEKRQEVFGWSQQWQQHWIWM